MVEPIYLILEFTHLEFQSITVFFWKQGTRTSNEKMKILHCTVTEHREGLRWLFKAIHCFNNIRCFTILNMHPSWKGIFNMQSLTRLMLLNYFICAVFLLLKFAIPSICADVVNSMEVGPAQVQLAYWSWRQPIWNLSNATCMCCVWIEPLSVVQLWCKIHLGL